MFNTYIETMLRGRQEEHISRSAEKQRLEPNIKICLSSLALNKYIIMTLVTTTDQQGTLVANRDIAQC